MSSRGESRAPASDQAVPRATVGRLSLYLRQLERFLKDGTKIVSSRRLGNAVGVTDAQVRKDLGYFGPFGRSGVGYQVESLMQTIRRILGTDRGWPVALVGIGNLGRALVGYRGFRRQGFQIQAIFDADPAKLGQAVEGIRVDSVDNLEQRVAEQRISMAIVAVPADAAQSVADRLVTAGIKGILNFAPVPLVVPADVSLVSVDLAIQLEGLSFQVQSGRQDEAAGE
jgi:redox-sensing transcriptional repressor